MYYVGIDLGTSAVKLILINEEGKILKKVSKDYPIYFPNVGWSEQNPNDWYNKTISGLKELINDIDKDKIDGIGIAGQMHGLVILDKYDNIIRPAILWNDNRTIKENEYLNNIIGKERLSEYTGNISFTGFTAPKLLWIKNNENSNFKKINKIMLPKDYLVYMLTGVHSTDVSDASGTLFFDVKNRCWSEKMLEICSIYKYQLPKIFESYEIVGNLKENLLNELGLKKNKIKVIAGAGDNAAAAIGTGTIGNGSCNISLGTSGTVFISNNSFTIDKNNSLHSFCHSDGKYHLLGCILSAASCNKWWIEEILKSKNYEEEQREITNLGENEVYFLPYLMGERSPHNDPNARGMFIGMNMDTKREDMTQAILEGVAFAFKDLIEISKSMGINIERSKICGGGSKSILWKEILANVLNMEIDVIDNEEGPSLGVAILAGVSCNAFNNIEDASSMMINIKETIKPKKELAIKYKNKYNKFKKIYPTISKLYDELMN